MLAFLEENLGTILIGAVLLAIIAAILWRMIRNRKKGSCSCGSGCEHCAGASACHGEKR